MYRPLIAASAFAAFATLAGPAAAQDDPGDQVNMVVVYGDDVCPQSTDTQIVVCARKDESERYRIPEVLRFSDDPANEAWAERVEELEMVGASGIMSCSPVGAGGATGCTQQLIDAYYREQENSSDVRFGQLIAEAREERLSTIDEAAAAEQARVEQIERQYMERLERERAAPAPGEENPEDAPLPTPGADPEPADPASPE